MNTHWTTLTERYRDDKQCLASFIAWQAAEVVARAKPANLINVLDKELPCERNIYRLWGQYSHEVLAQGALCALELRQQDGRLLVLIYQPELLDRVIRQHVVRKTLGRLGYRYDDLDGALAHLKVRMGANDFPHEIGFFLGYPLKDVLGFMGLVELPLAANGPWKMYGKLEKSLATLKAHKAAREAILKRLDAKHSPLQLIRRKGPGMSLAA